MRSALGWWIGVGMIGVGALTTSARAQYALQGSLTSTLWLRENARSLLDVKDPSDPNATVTTFLQYFRFSASRLPSNRQGTFAQFYLSGRWKDEFETQTNIADTPSDFLVYEFYLDLATPRRRSVRMGRQYLPNTAGFWELDGIRWQERIAWARVLIYGGRGAASWEREKRPIFGGQVEVRAGNSGRVRGGAMTTFSDNTTSYLFFGFDAATNSPLAVHPSDGLQGTATADLAFEPTYRRVARASGVARLRSERVLIWTGIRYDTPSFPEDSLFRVFAVEPTREASLGLEMRPFSWLALNGHVTRQQFDDGSANRRRVETAFYDASEPLLRLGIEWITWGQRSRRYFYFRAQRQVLPFLTLGAGNALNAYRFADDRSSLFTRTTHGEVRIRFSSNWRLFVRVEWNRNPDYRMATRALGWLQTSFSVPGSEP